MLMKPKITSSWLFFVETTVVPTLYDKDLFLFIQASFLRGHFTEYDFLLRDRRFQGSDIHKGNKQPGSTVSCIRNLTGRGNGKGRINSNQFRLGNFLMQIIFQYHISTKAIQNTPKILLPTFVIFPLLCLNSASLVALNLTLYTRQNTCSITGISGCSSGNQEYCWFSKANEPAFLNFSSSF